MSKRGQKAARSNAMSGAPILGFRRRIFSGMRGRPSTSVPSLVPWLLQLAWPGAGWVKNHNV